ncbi:MAG TPA: c-type cytochrome [Bryobacteraceae bacterium]|nr:c-type cytochrome [Bryobacteraceae bacterium]
MKKMRTWDWRMAPALVALTLGLGSWHMLKAQRRTESPKNLPAPTSPFSGNATEGKALYYSYGCYACHGYTGETGPRPFVGRWGHLENEQTFITFLRQRANVAPVTPSGSMPNFSAQVLPDPKAKDIYAYIRTFKSNAPQAKDPTLSAIIDAAKHEKN